MRLQASKPGCLLPRAAKNSVRSSQVPGAPFFDVRCPLDIRGYVRPSLGRTQAASLRIASSDSGEYPAAIWKVCSWSGKTSIRTSTPALRAFSSNWMLSPSSVSSPPTWM